MLAWDVRLAEVDVVAGVLPSSLKVMTLKLCEGQRILPGAIPAGLKLLGLRAQDFPKREEELQLPAGVSLWWMD